MHVGLVPGVEQQYVSGRVEASVRSDSQLDRAQVRSQPVRDVDHSSAALGLCVWVGGGSCFGGWLLWWSAVSYSPARLPG
jgi:hypothetical protein